MAVVTKMIHVSNLVVRKCTEVSWGQCGSYCNYQPEEDTEALHITSQIPTNVTELSCHLEYYYIFME
jgi:hypothetical protein